MCPPRRLAGSWQQAFFLGLTLLLPVLSCSLFLVRKQRETTLWRGCVHAPARLGPASARSGTFPSEQSLSLWGGGYTLHRRKAGKEEEPAFCRMTSRG